MIAVKLSDGRSLRLSDKTKVLARLEQGYAKNVYAKSLVEFLQQKRKVLLQSLGLWVEVINATEI